MSKNTKKEIEFHPICECFPLMSEEKLEELAENIKENGLLNPIVTFEEKILDGRNRYLACLKVGVEHRFIRLEDILDKLEIQDLVNFLEKYAVAMNIKRRQLTSAQKVETGLNLKQLRKKKDEPISEENTIKDILEDNKIVILREYKENKEIARNISSTPEKVKQVKEIREIAKENPEIAKSFERALKGETSIDSVYRKATGKPKKHRKPEKDKILVKKLQAEIKELKEKNKELKRKYKQSEKEKKALEDKLNIITKLLIPQEVEIKEKKRSPFPTPKELRKAEIIK